MNGVEKDAQLNEAAEKIIKLAMDNFSPSESALILGAVVGCMAKVSSNTDQFLFVVDKVARDIISGEGLKDAS